MLIEPQESLKLIHDFWVGVVKNDHGHETLKSAYLKNE